MKIVIRTDVSIQIGIGHVMRCLTLADTLKNYTNIEVTFVCRDQLGLTRTMITDRGYKLISLPKITRSFEPGSNEPTHAKWLGVSWTQDIEDTLQGIGKNNVDWIIVDHYAIDYRWHQLARKFCNKIMVIDDLADRKYDCDVLLDQTFGRTSNAYQLLVPKVCQLLLGPKFALLRNEFSLLRPKALEKRRQISSISHILISLGTLDPDNITKRVLDALSSVKWVKPPVVDLVLGSSSPSFDRIKKITKNYPLDIYLYTDISNMAELMLKSDLSIGAGGTTSWERCCMALPTILLVLAENQVLTGKNLDKAGATITLLEDTELEENIKNAVDNLIENRSKYLELSNCTAAICSGAGATKVAQEILK